MNSTSEGAVAEQLELKSHVQPKRFLGLSLKNGLLNLVTLTLYRFWGRTEVRRRIWAATQLNGDAFEYTGRGKELFLGFVLVLVGVVMPLLIAIFAAQFFAPKLAGAILLPIYILMGFLAGVGRFTAFRYLASRTVWRGVSFRLLGSPVSYGFKTLGYGFIAGITLGWFWPAAERRLAAPLWDGLRFGDRRFRFSLTEARKSKVYGAYAIGWLCTLVVYAVTVGLFFVIMAPLASAPRGSLPPADLIIKIYAVTGVMVLGLTVAFAPYHAAALRSVVAGIQFEDARFKLRLGWLAMAWLWVSNLILLVISLGFLMPFIEARASKFLLDRVETSGTAALDAAQQVAGQRPSVGEGLADALGMATI